MSSEPIVGVGKKESSHVEQESGKKVVFEKEVEKSFKG